MGKVIAKDNILDEILENKRQEVKREKMAYPLSGFFPLLQKSKCNPLSEIFPAGRVNIIGEIKRKSPYNTKGFTKETIEIVNTYEHYCRGVSVLTDSKYFGMSLDDLAIVRTTSNLPILRKDFIVDEYQIYESRLYGADMVLFIASALSYEELSSFLKIAKRYGMHGLVEVHDQDDLQKALDVDAKLIGINNRDLRTSEIDLHRTLELGLRIPREAYVISESGIESREDIELLRYNVDGFLIGNSLLKSDDIQGKLIELTTDN